MNSSYEVHSPQFIEDLAERALNLAVGHIQLSIAVTTGDCAGRFFSDNQTKNSFIDYIKQELSERAECSE